MDTRSLGSEFPMEQARCRELLVEYVQRGDAGALGAAHIRSVLDEADLAVSRQDVVAMLRSYAQMKELHCDECAEPIFQILADATKEPVEYRRRCKAHMEPEGPFPASQQERLD